MHFSPRQLLTGIVLWHHYARIHVAKSNVAWQHDVNSRKHLPNTVNVKNSPRDQNNSAITARIAGAAGCR